MFVWPAGTNNEFSVGEEVRMLSSVIIEAVVRIISRMHTVMIYFASPDLPMSNWDLISAVRSSLLVADSISEDLFSM